MFFCNLMSLHTAVLQIVGIVAVVAGDAQLS